MEVATGEHGNFIDTLVTAVLEGKCNEFKNTETLKKNINSDIQTSKNSMNTCQSQINGSE